MNKQIDANCEWEHRRELNRKHRRANCKVTARVGNVAPENEHNNGHKSGKCANYVAARLDSDQQIGRQSKVTIF